MLLVLEKPSSDKYVHLTAYGLAGDKGFDPARSQTRSFDSERFRFDCAVREVNESLGTRLRKAFSMLFNQCRWEGTSGWEYWSDDYGLVLKHALIVAAAMQSPLHVHVDFQDEIMLGAEAAGIKFSLDSATPVKRPGKGDLEFINRDIVAGKYLTIKDVVLPAGLPEPPDV